MKWNESRDADDNDQEYISKPHGSTKPIRSQTMKFHVNDRLAKQRSYDDKRKTKKTTMTMTEANNQGKASGFR